MESKQLGATGIRVPEIGLGTHNFTAGIEPLRAGLEAGACLIDTAEIYGTEAVVGEAIRECRDRVFLATKVAPRNFRRRDVIAAAERSLRQLRTDYIDLYQLHWPNYTVPIAETMAAMEELADAGKIRFIGVSSFSVAELKRANSCLSRHTIVSNQVRYSLIDRTVQTGLLEYCQRRAVTVIAFSPLGISFPRMRAADPEGVLGRVAGLVGKTEAQVALNWLIAQDNVIAIPKASTVSHVVEDCCASGWRLPEEHRETLERGIRFRRRGLFESAARRTAKHVRQLSGRSL